MNDEIERTYWSIHQVATKLKVAESAIRFWETEFEFYVKRNSRNERRFTKENIVVFERIQYLLKVRKFTIEGAKEELKTPDSRFKR